MKRIRPDKNVCSINDCFTIQKNQDILLQSAKQGVKSFTFDNIQQSFIVIINSWKTRKEGYRKVRKLPQSDGISAKEPLPKCEILKAFSLRSGIRQAVLAIFIQYSIRSPSYSNQTKNKLNKIKGNQTGKVKVKLFADAMMLYA